MPLTDAACRNARLGADGSQAKYSDDKGLYLLVKPVGKYWRLDYRFGGKRKTLALGVYPAVSLKDARERRDEARKLLEGGADPGEARKAQKAAGSLNAANSFEVIAREWHTKFLPTWTVGHADKIMRRFERDVFPWLGKPSSCRDRCSCITGRAAADREQGRDRNGSPCHAECRAGIRYAIATGRAQRNPAADLVGALAPAIKQSFPTITDPIRIAELLRAIDGYQGTLPTLCALRLAPLVFVRPGELRKAEWSEIDLDGSTWIIPAERMKMREKHVVPLSERAVSILRELHPLTGGGRYVFPGARTNGRPMSENTVNAALRRLGYDKDTMTGHGFRHMASTLLNEQGWNRDAIERQMAHAERNQVRAVYNYAEYLPERRKMMQAWSDYLGALKAGTAAKPLLRVA